MAEDNSVLMGRKIFFLNPPYSLKKDMIPALQTQEYEIYTADNFLYLKNILKTYKDSLLFITPDNQFSSKAYFNYVHSFYDDKDLKDIKIGIIAKQPKDAEKELYLTKGKLELGYSILDDKNEEKQIESLKSLFDMHNAKGRRQYVRVNCIDDKDAKVFWTVEDKMHLFNILDMSSAAIAVKAPLYLGQILKPESILHNLTLVLDGKQYTFDASIYAVKPKEDCVITILLLRKNILPETMTAIRKYIALHLQQAAQKLGESMPKDTTAYTSLPYYDEAMGKTKGDDGKKTETSGEQEIKTENDSTAEVEQESKTDADSSSSDIPAQETEKEK